MGKHKKRTHSEDRDSENKKLRRKMQELKALALRCLPQPLHDATNMAAMAPEGENDEERINSGDSVRTDEARDIGRGEADPKQTDERATDNQEAQDGEPPLQGQQTEPQSIAPQTDGLDVDGTVGEPTLVLDEDRIKIIGEELETTENCVKIHSSIANRWNHCLKAGLKKEVKDELLKKYPRAGNCLLEAPTLNPEILPTLNEAALKRDNYFCATQKLAGSTVSALWPVVALLLENETVDSKTILSNVWEATMMQTELHHSQSTARRAYILPGLTKQVAASLEKREIDTHLFGDNLGEKIKEIKVLDKVSQELKIPTTKKIISNSSGNWKSPPRQRKSTTSTGYRPKYQPKTSTQKNATKQPTQYRSNSTRNQGPRHQQTFNKPRPR